MERRRKRRKYQRKRRKRTTIRSVLDLRRSSFAFSGAKQEQSTAHQHQGNDDKGEGGKETHIYSSARRDPDLNEDVMDKPHFYTFWTKEDEEFELNLREHLVLPKEALLVARHFSNYVENFEELVDLRYAQKAFVLSCLTYFSQEENPSSS